MVARAAFSDPGLRSLPLPESGQKFYWDAKLSCFGCRVSQGGTKTFLIKRKNTFVTIGRYPLISLSAARTEAKRLLAEFTLGKTRPDAIGYEAAVKLFIAEKKRNRRTSTTNSYKGLLNSFSFVGAVSEISASEVQRKLAQYKTEGSYNHHLVALRVFFNWCIKRKYRTDNPTLGLSTYKRPKRARVLTDDELQLIWLATDSEELPLNFRNIIKLLMLTGQRRGEIAALQESFYSHNAQTICLPDKLTKNSRKHTFPIGALAVSIISRIKTSETFFFFTIGRRNTPEVFSAWSKNKKRLDKISSVTGWTLHDLRRSFRTGLGALSVLPHIAERLVNHVSAKSEMEETYDLGLYLPEMREAMNRWEEKLQKIFAGELCVALPGLNAA